MVGLAIANRSELPVALVTGAAGGMGSALSRLLGQTHFLVLSDANPDRLSQAGQLLEDEGYQLSCIAGDLADPSLAQALAETCSENGALRSVVAGLAVTITTSPFTNARTHMMAYPGVYRGLPHALVSIGMTKGPQGYFRGFAAQWARFGPYATVQFVAWEQLRLLCGLPGI